MSIRAAISKANILAALADSATHVLQIQTRTHRKQNVFHRTRPALSLTATKKISASVWGFLGRRSLFKGRCASHYDFWWQSASMLVSSGESKGWLAPSSCSPFQHPTHNWASCPRKRGRLSVCESGPGRPESSHRAFRTIMWIRCHVHYSVLTITAIMLFLLLLCSRNTWFFNGFVFCLFP